MNKCHCHLENCHNRDGNNGNVTLKRGSFFKNMCSTTCNIAVVREIKGFYNFLQVEYFLEICYFNYIKKIYGLPVRRKLSELCMNIKKLYVI